MKNMHHISFCFNVPYCTLRYYCMSYCALHVLLETLYFSSFFRKSEIIKKFCGNKKITKSLKIDFKLVGIPPS